MSDAADLTASPTVPGAPTMSRRNIITAAAWAAPAIVVATAAPAAATSPEGYAFVAGVFNGSKSDLKHPGTSLKYNSVTLTRIANGSSYDFDITAITITFISTQQNHGTDLEVTTAGWSSSELTYLPVGDNFQGTLVLRPTLANGSFTTYPLSGSDTVTVEWGLSRFDPLTKIEIDGTSGGVVIPTQTISLPS